MGQLLHDRAGAENTSQNKVTALKIICQAYIGMQCPAALALIKLNQTEVVTQVRKVECQVKSQRRSQVQLGKKALQRVRLN